MQMELWNPVIKIEFSVLNITEFAKIWMDTSKVTVTVWSQIFHVDWRDPFVYSLVIPVFHSQISTAPVLHRLQALLLPLVPLDKVKNWLLVDKSRNFSIPDSFT